MTRTPPIEPTSDSVVRWHAFAGGASPEWNAARERAGAGPHFGDGWIACREAQGLRAQRLLLEVGGAPVAVGVVHLKRPRFRPWVRTTALLDRLPMALPREGGGAPAISDDAIARALVAFGDERGFGRIELDSFDGPSPPPDLAALGLATRARFEFLLDLAAPAETRFAALKSSHRRKVRDAEKSGVTVADETGATPVDLLRELQGQTQERRAGRGEEMELPDRELYARLERCFLGAGGRLFVGRKEGTPMSAILCGVEGRRAYYFMGGTSKAGFECNAATLVLWRASVLLAEKGATLLNLGGVPREAEHEDHAAHGLYRFKEGFGAARVDCTSATWVRGASQGTPR